MINPNPARKTGTCPYDREYDREMQAGGAINCRRRLHGLDPRRLSSGVEARIERLRQAIASHDSLQVLERRPGLEIRPVSRATVPGDSTWQFHFGDSLSGIARSQRLRLAANRGLICLLCGSAQAPCCKIFLSRNALDSYTYKIILLYECNMLIFYESFVL